MKRTLTQKLGLLGVVSLLSYTAAVVLSPLAYPGYDWMAQAVSDLSAANAPSLALWNQLSALYNTCEVVCVTAVCIGMQGQKSRLLRTGVYLFAAMEWISAGAKDRRCRSYGICAGVALGMMLTGALGIQLMPAAYFGVAERFSVFAATGFNAALGLHLFCTAAEANYKENENAKQSLSPSA